MLSLSLLVLLLLLLLRVLAQTLVQVKVLVKVCAQLIAWQVSGAPLAVPFLACPLPSPSVGLSSLLPTLLSVLEALAVSLPSAVQLLLPFLLFPAAAAAPCWLWQLSSFPSAQEQADTVPLLLALMPPTLAVMHVMLLSSWLEATQDLSAA